MCIKIVCLLFVMKCFATERFEFSSNEDAFFHEELSLEGSPLQAETKPEKVKVTTTYLKQGAQEMIIHFPKEVALKSSVKNNALFLEFNQPVDSKDFEKAGEDLGYILRRLANGLNTLYLEGSKPVIYEAYALGNLCIVHIFPNYNKPFKATRSLKVARARYLVETRNYRRAFQALACLNREYPQDKDVGVLSAILEGLLPRWQEQMHIFEQLRRAFPEDEDIRDLLRDTYEPHSPYLKMERQMQRTVHIGVLQLGTLESEQILDRSYYHYLYAKELGTTARGHIASVLDNQGNTVGFLGRRNQAEVRIRNELACGTTYESALFTGDGDALGGEVRGTWLIPLWQGDLSIKAYWHKPYWGTFESFVHYGREDLIRADMNGVLNRYFTWSLGSGFNRVGIAGVSDGFTSVLLSGQSFIFLNIVNPLIAFNYALEADYITHRAVRIGSNGLPYNPVPLSSYENHTLRGYLYYDWRERFHFVLYGGENFNRLGTHDWTAGVSAVYIKPCPCAYEIRAALDRFPSTTVVGAVAEYLTLSFTMRF